MSYTAAVITVSDLGSQGKRIDTSGPAVCAMLEGAGFSVTPPLSRMNRKKSAKR